MNSLKYLRKIKNPSHERSHTDTAMNCVLLSELPALKGAAVNYQSLNTPGVQFAPAPAAIQQKTDTAALAVTHPVVRHHAGWRRVCSRRISLKKSVAEAVCFGLRSAKRKEPNLLRRLVFPTSG